MRLAAIILAWVCATSASAADLTVQVKTPAGAPVADAVVAVYPAAGQGEGPIHFDWPMTMAQHNIQFEPFVLVAPVGATVAFPNLDSVRHHVYSFSPTHPFELKLYSKDQTRSVRFDKPGVIALGCNIHDVMIAFIKVVDTRYAAKTDARGVVVIHDLPLGAATLRLWQPYLKAPDNEIALEVNIPAAGLSHAFAVDVKTAPTMKPMY